MDKETVISVEKVSKKYCKSLKKSMYYGATDIGRNMFGLSSKSGSLRKDEFWALNDISFEVKKGETLGIIGPNGSGKTTLLKLLNGIFWPDKGKITVKGRVGALIELGAGFHPLLTGRENVYINGAILGMTKRQVDEKFDEIMEFADIGDFIDSPVKNYSSGMYVRLGFSIAIHSSPDLLLVDEALSVGDAQFVQKCLGWFTQFREKGGTTIFVSHDMNLIKTNCEKAILLEHGSILDEAKPKEIIDAYNALIFEKIAANIEGKDISSNRSIITKEKGISKVQYQHYGTGEAEILEANLVDLRERPLRTINSGEEGIFRIRVGFKTLIKDVVVGITIRNNIGLDMYGVNTLWKNMNIGKCRVGDVLVVEFKQTIMLGRGDYYVNVAINEKAPEGLIRLDWVPDMIQFSVVQGEEYLGFFDLNSDISFKFIPNTVSINGM
jgi:lipopolysaccharide transport system ATP-binding protein